MKFWVWNGVTDNEPGAAAPQSHRTAYCGRGWVGLSPICQLPTGSQLDYAWNSRDPGQHPGAIAHSERWSHAAIDAAQLSGKFR